jgi:hypothetical protein
MTGFLHPPVSLLPASRVIFTPDRLELPPPPSRLAQVLPALSVTRLTDSAGVMSALFIHRPITPSRGRLGEGAQFTFPALSLPGFTNPTTVGAHITGSRQRAESSHRLCVSVRNNTHKPGVCENRSFKFQVSNFKLQTPAKTQDPGQCAQPVLPLSRPPFLASRDAI